MIATLIPACGNCVFTSIVHFAVCCRIVQAHKLRGGQARAAETAIVNAYFTRKDGKLIPNPQNPKYEEIAEHFDVKTYTQSIGGART